MPVTYGVVRWSGILRAGEVLTIDQGRPSTGSINGRFPGQPVTVKLDDAAQFDMLEVPSPENAWKRVRLRNRVGERTQITILWSEDR